MFEKEVKARKEHVCVRCNGIIRKGNMYKYVTGKTPKLDNDHETQIGIEYFTDRVHLNDMCDGVLSHVYNPAEYLKNCTKGLHEFQEIYEFDHYVGMHRVYVRTGDYACVNCGKKKLTLNKK